MRTAPALLLLLTADPGPHDGAHPGHAHAQRAAASGEGELFEYDPADVVVEAALLAKGSAYDPSVVDEDGAARRAWLEHGPFGDRLEPAGIERWQLAHPTLTRSAGRTWTTCEVRAREPDAGLGRAGAEPWRLAVLEGEELRPLPWEAVAHAAAAGTEADGLWLALQRHGEGGAYEIAVARLPAGEREPSSLAAPVVVSEGRGGWAPDVAVGPDGDVLVVWDAYDGSSFGVLARRRDERGWGPVVALAASEAFEARATCAFDSAGRAWVAWEEGARGWGQPYRGTFRLWNDSTDASGPLHRLRRVRLALLEEDGRVRHLAQGLPMPSFARAAALEDRREGGAELGVFYERPELVVDGKDRPWVVYRHYFARQVGCTDAVRHHVESGWTLDARCLAGAGWSPLYRMSVGQRDGAQRLSLAPTADGFHAAWATGRTDRRPDERERGVWGATVRRAGEGTDAPGAALLREPVRVELPARPEPRAAAARAQVGGREWRLAFGDLHRHTDLSLCFTFFDGSLDDAYRYAIEVAGLDFLGVTDHTRDIDRGNVQSLLWWRATREVSRHHAPGRFLPFFAYERSHGDTDHNVISLRDDVLRDFRPPLPDFWATIDPAETITIPHSTPNAEGIPFNGRVWDYQDDERRPLLEVYQGFRAQSSLAEAQVPLARGFHLGLIASSDHLSTSASYACVWTDELERGAVFRSLRARRTFGATTRLRLVFRAGDAWMGERIERAGPVRFDVELDAPASIEAVEVWVDGAVARELEVGAGASSLAASFELGPFDRSEHWVFLRVVLADGNLAWSSPIWVRGA